MLGASDYRAAGLVEIDIQILGDVTRNNANLRR